MANHSFRWLRPVRHTELEGSSDAMRLRAFRVRRPFAHSRNGSTLDRAHANLDRAAPQCNGGDRQITDTCKVWMTSACAAPLSAEIVRIKRAHGHRCCVTGASLSRKAVNEAPMHAPKVQRTSLRASGSRPPGAGIESLVRLVDACLNHVLRRTLKSPWHRGVCPRARSAHEQRC